MRGLGCAVLICFFIFCISSPFLAAVTHAAQEAGVAGDTTDGPERGRILGNRLLMIGTLLGMLLGLLSVLYGYLKINHATRGFYSGRLQSVSTVAAIVVLALGYLFYLMWKH